MLFPLPGMLSPQLLPQLPPFQPLGLSCHLVRELSSDLSHYSLTVLCSPNNLSLISAVPLTSCVTLGKLLNLSVSVSSLIWAQHHYLLHRLVIRNIRTNASLSPSSHL